MRVSGHYSTILTPHRGCSSFPTCFCLFQLILFPLHPLPPSLPPPECTFILLDKSKSSSLPPSFSPSSMVGDVNLFFNDQDNDISMAEIEIMIAEPTARGRGMGKEGVGMMMQHAVETLGVKRFYCKISGGNEASLRMFEG